MKGLELASAYYEAFGRGMIRERFPRYEQRVAAGLVGMGSECFGFDDEVSTDHDFGPAFCLWLTPDDHAEVGEAMRLAYESLPGEYMGFSARREGPHSGGRIGVQTVDMFYRRHIGRSAAPETPMDWLRIPEANLAAATNGRVFADPLGVFSAVRRDLLAFYPDGVRMKKIAARASAMGQSGQYNYPRAMVRGETVTAGLALAEFARAAMSMAYLVNRRYAPFYKWMRRGMRELPVLHEIGDMLDELSLLSPDESRWRYGEPRAMLRKLNAGDGITVIVEEICRLVGRRLRDEGLSDCGDDFLAAHAESITGRIADASLRGLHMTEG